MDDHFFQNLLAGQSREEMHWETTRDYLASLAPEVEDAAYRCAIVHWFNADLLRSVLRAGHLDQLGRIHQRLSKSDANELYEKLQSLPFVEEFPGLGHNFHDLTRQTILEYLWRNERKFYQKVSSQAVKFFLENIESEEGADWEVVVEWMYNLLVADEKEALRRMGEILTDFGKQGYTALCHALVQAAEEQADAQRISKKNLPLIRMWRGYVAYLADNLTQVEQIWRELNTAPGGQVPTWIQAQVSFYYADSLYRASHYQESYELFQKTIPLYEKDGSPADIASTLVSLGKACSQLSQYSEAEGYYHQALEVYVPTLFYDLAGGDNIVEAEEPSKELQESEPSKPAILLFHEPEGWGRFDLNEVIAAEEKQEPEGNGTPALYENEPWYGIALVDDDEAALASILKSETRWVPVEITTDLAEIWLALGNLHHVLDEYPRAIACARLAGSMYSDLGDAYGVQRATQLLFSMGVARAEKEIMESNLSIQMNLLEIAQQHGDRYGELGALMGIADAQKNAGDYSQAHKSYEDALELARAMDSKVSIAAAIYDIADLDRIAGNYELATSRFEQAMEIYRQVGYKEGEAQLLLSLGDFERDRFHTEGASNHYQTSLDLFTDLKIPTGQISALRGLGLVAQDRAHYPEAIDYFEKAAELSRKIQRPSTEIICLQDLARIYNLRGDQEKARDHYGRGIDLARELGRRVDEADLLVSLSYVALEEEKYDEAMKLCSDARDIYVGITQPNGEMEAIFGILAVLQKGEDKLAAIQTAQDVLKLAERLNDHAQKIRAMMELALAQSRAGQSQQAVKLMEEIVELEPNYALAAGNLGWILYEARQYERSIESSTRAFEMDSSQTWVLRNIGHAWLALGNDKKAEEMYRKAIELRHEGEHFKETIKEIKQLLERHPDAPRGVELLSLIEETQARIDKQQKNL